MVNLDPELDVAAAAMVAAQARFVVIGGFAVIANRFIRATEDIYFLIPDDPENDRRVLTALIELGGRRLHARSICHWTRSWSAARASRTPARPAKSDVQVIEDALAVFLGLRALEEARAQGTLAADEADRLAVQEVRAVRQARRQAA